MTVTSTVRPGQVWCYRDDALALVTAVEGRSAYVEWVNGPRAGEQIHVTVGEFADSGDWMLNLTDWHVAFAMVAGGKQRRFTMTVPATGEQGARTAAHGMAWAINEGSDHVWKIVDDVSVEAA